MSPEEPPEENEAEIIPIGALTREATFRRFAEIARRTDPVPSELSAAIGQIPSRHGPPEQGEELADLVYDSEDDDEALAGVRATPGGTRRLTFEASDLALEVEVTLTGRRSLLCQLVPAQSATLELRGASGATRSLEDREGTFHVTDVSRGPLSLRCRPTRPGASVVSTTWVRV